MQQVVAIDSPHQQAAYSPDATGGMAPVSREPVHAHQPRGSTAGDLALALGWLSLGLGIASLMMPRAMARTAGLVPRDDWMRVIGVREIISGAGIVLRPDKPQWLWSRVAGDLMDFGLMALAPRQRHDTRIHTISAALAGITVLDLLAATDKTRRLRRGSASTLTQTGGLVRVKKSLNVNQSPEACYRFWRDFENFPRFMQHVEAVQVIDATRSHWQVRGPFRQHLNWEAELSSDVPGQQLGWRTRAGADIAHAGIVRFSPAPGQRGTRIEVDMEYHAPLGKAGVMLARMTGEEPSQQLNEDLRRFKQLIETGEIPTTIGQPAGRRSALGRLVHQGAPG